MMYADKLKRRWLWQLRAVLTFNIVPATLVRLGDLGKQAHTYSKAGKVTNYFL